MARIRSIHPGIFTDEGFMSVSPLARVLLIGIFTECDDSGVFEWKPLTLKMRVLPVDSCDVPSLLDELLTNEKVQRFEVNGKSYGAVKNFGKWQRPKSPQCIHPVPENLVEYLGLQNVDSEAKPERGTALGKSLCDGQGGKCFYCETDITFYRKKPNSLQIDHKIPVSRGGADAIENLVATCKPCNSLKANMTDGEFRSKFAPSELRERHNSLPAKQFSQVPNILSLNPKVVSGEIAPQMEDEGCSKEEKVSSETSSDVPQSEKKRRSKNDYPQDFQTFYAAYPADPGMSKPEALKAWLKLTPDDRDKALKAIPAFKAWVAKQGRDYRTVHACRYLSQRRFEGFDQAASSNNGPEIKLFPVILGSPEWHAWCAHKGKTLPDTDLRGSDGGIIGRGWYCQTQWPPDTKPDPVALYEKLATLESARAA